MKVIISTELDDNVFSNFVVKKTFKEVRDLKGVTTLIIHKYKETDFDTGVFITQFKNNGISQFFYINENPSATMQMVMKGVNGTVLTDEFYFEHEDDLIEVLESFGVVDEEDSSETTQALEVVDDFVTSFANGDDRIKAPLYLERVQSAVTDLVELSHQQELQLATMGASACEVFEKASAIIKNMDAQNRLIQKQLAELEKSQNDMVSSRPAFGNSIMFFAPYKYLGNAKILLIREYSPCRYLTSFCLGYLHHLHYELNRRPKLIFVHQKGAGVAAKYSDFTNITDSSNSIQSLYDSEIVATNDPKKEVLRDLTSRSNDVIIVVDRLYGSQDIITGRVTKVNAVSSQSDINRFKIKPEETIFSVTAQPKQLFALRNISKYPVEIDSRYAAYSQLMHENYLVLDKKIGFGVER